MGHWLRFWLDCCYWGVPAGRRTLSSTRTRRGWIVKSNGAHNLCHYVPVCPRRSLNFQQSYVVQPNVIAGKNNPPPSPITSLLCQPPKPWLPTPLLDQTRLWHVACFISRPLLNGWFYRLHNSISLRLTRLFTEQRKLGSAYFFSNFQFSPLWKGVEG